MALHFDPIPRQWAKLSLLQGVRCLWKPSECCSGATVAMWLNTMRVAGSDSQSIVGTQNMSWHEQRFIVFWDVDDKFRCEFGPSWTWNTLCIVHFENLCYNSFVSCYCSFSVQTNTTQYYAYTHSAPSATWFHGVFVFHGPTSGISLYINAVLVSTKSNGWSPDGGFRESAGEVLLGREFGSGDYNYADATVDELYFWEEALSGGQIAALYAWYPWHDELRRRNRLNLGPCKLLYFTRENQTNLCTTVALLFLLCLKWWIKIVKKQPVYLRVFTFLMCSFPLSLQPYNMFHQALSCTMLLLCLGWLCPVHGVCAAGWSTGDLHLPEP